IVLPFFTGELKSASRLWMRPDTCAPTCTVTSAESVPVAVTRATTRPRSAFTVSNFGAADLREQPASASAANTMAAALPGRMRFGRCQYPGDARDGSEFTELYAP